MTENDCVADIVNQLKNGRNQIIYKEGFVPLYKRTVQMLIQRGIIEVYRSSYSKQLTDRGYEFMGSNLTFSEWVKPKPIIPTINNGNIIGGNVDGSNLNIDSPTNHISENKKTSLLERLSWIAGIIAVLITIYEIFIKSHIKWIP